MVGLLYQVSYLGATYYAVPVYYPGSTIFQSWYLIAYINNVLYPYQIVPSSAVTVIYNPYLSGGTGGSGGSGGGSGVGSINGLTGALTITGTNGVTVTQTGTTINIAGSGTGTGTGSLTGGGTPSAGVIASPTAPTNPTGGQYWLNTGGTTVSGIPAGQYARWDPTTNSWVVVGATTPTNVNSVIALNGLQGNVTLTPGSNITITPSGNSLVIASTGGAGGTSGVSTLNSLSGALTLAAGSNVTITPSGSTLTIASTASGVTTLNTLSGAVTLTAGTNITITPSGNNLTIASTAGGVTTLNTLSGAVTLAAGSNVTLTASGNTITIAASIAAGTGEVNSVNSITGAVVIQGTANQITVTPSGQNIGLSLAPGANNTYLQTNGSGSVVWDVLPVSAIPVSVRNPGFSLATTIAVSVPLNLWSPFNPGGALTDPANGYNAVSGTYTIPSGLGGLWLFIVNWANNIPTYPDGLFTAITVNAATVTTSSQTAGVGPQMTTGTRVIPCAAGDIIRFFAFPQVVANPAAVPGGVTITAATTSGFLVFPI